MLYVRIDNTFEWKKKINDILTKKKNQNHEQQYLLLV